MPVTLVAQEWEAAYFARRIFRLQITGTVTSAELADAVASAPPHDLLEIVATDPDLGVLGAARACGFFVADHFHHFSHCATGETVASHRKYARHWLTYVRPATAADIDALHNLVPSIEFSNRFYRSPFSLNDGARYHCERLTKAVHGLFDDYCLVLPVGGAISGFLTLRFDGNSGHDWTLMGMDPRFRGVGGAQALWVAAERFGLEANRPHVTMKAAPDNRAVIRNFRKGLGGDRVGESWHLYRVASHRTAPG